MKYPTFEREAELAKKYSFVAGIDEAGRGPLAGPVVAACVVLDIAQIKSTKPKDRWWKGARDSKLMTQKHRAEMVKNIKQNALCFGIGISSEKHIDEINIHNATLRAMNHAVLWCATKPDFLIIDGKFTIPNLDCDQEAIIKGDAQVLSIALASIIAKTTRDTIMENYDRLYPKYEFKKHKGYPTALHRNMVKKYGLSPIHRKSFLIKY
jgi:ribonuclease HII